MLQEPVPSGALGALRVLAFVADTIGAVLLAHPDGRAVKTSALPVESQRSAPFRLSDRDGRLGREHAEAVGLLEVERDRLGVV